MVTTLAAPTMANSITVDDNGVVSLLIVGGWLFDFQLLRQSVKTPIPKLASDTSASALPLSAITAVLFKFWL